HNHLLGGGFGRRLETDYVGQAVKFAKQVEGPLKVTWSREEDMQHDYYRFHNHSRVKVGLDAAGLPVSWRHRIVGPNIMSRFLPVYQKDGIDLDIVDAALGPYKVPNVFVDFVRNEAPLGLATGNWRGVGATRNVFIVESVIDELARRAGSEPVAYRRGLLTGAPRVRAVLDALASRALWSSAEPLPQDGKRRGKGLAVFEAFGSYIAMAAQVAVDAAGAVKVEQVDCVVDTGFVVNPDIVRAQLEGGINFGLSAVLYGRITVADGRIVQGNFDTYPVLRMHEAPRIEVEIIQSVEEPGGVGEPGTSGIFAAVANAIFDATGTRLLAMPLDPAQLREVSA
ncbi:MAG: xanthine dehydrogenase family protein molybdopterin-binding subunit, partial [Oxalobacteraceae bacterium]